MPVGRRCDSEWPPRLPDCAGMLLSCFVRGCSAVPAERRSGWSGLWSGGPESPSRTGAESPNTERLVRVPRESPAAGCDPAARN